MGTLWRSAPLYRKIPRYARSLSTAHIQWQTCIPPLFFRIGCLTVNLCYCPPAQAKWNHIVNMPCTLYRMPSGEYEEKLMKVKLQVPRVDN